MIGILGIEVHFRSIVRRFLIFLIITILNIFKQKNLTYPPSYTKNVSAPMLCLDHVFYALKQLLSEMIEIIPPCHTLKCTRQMFRVKFLVSSKIRIFKQCSRMNVMSNFLGTLKIRGRAVA
jgi:hypothetical protein